jgi:hypothetical protein
VASGGGYVSTHLKAHKLHGILTCLGAADVKTESQLEECVFTVLDAKDPSCSSVVTYGQHLILADQHGLVMNNKNGGVTGYIGPRPADNRGSIVLCFINAADEKGCIGKAVQFGDNGVAIDIVKSNRFRTDYNKRLTNFKKVTSNLKAGYLCCDGQGFPLTFGIRRDQRSHVTVLKSIFHEQHTKQAAADDKKRLQEEEEDAKSLVQQSMDVIEGLGEEQQEFLQLSCLGLSVRNWIPLLLFLCALFLFNLTPRQIAGLVCASIGVLFLFSQDKKQRAQAAKAAKAVLDPPPYSVEEDGNSAVSQQEQEQKQQRVIVIFEGQEHVVPSQFLVAEQHNIANAKTRYLSTLQWRTEQNIDTLLQKKPQYFEQFKKHSVQYVHNRDKQGHIVYIERPKSFNLEALNALGIYSTTVLEQHYLFLFEY